MPKRPKFPYPMEKENLVETYQFGGVTVEMYNSAYIDLSPDEIRKRIQDVYKGIGDIMARQYKLPGLYIKQKLD